MIKRMKSFLVALALVSAVSVNAGAAGLSVQGASGNPYGRAMSSTYTFGTSGDVTIGSGAAWMINIPINASSNVTYHVGGVWTGTSESSAWVMSSSAGVIGSVGLSSGSESTINVTGANQTMFIRLTAGSTGAVAKSARAY